MPEDGTTDFDAYDGNYGELVNRALAFSGITFDFFARVKVDYFVDLIESLQPPAERTEVIDVGCGIANSHRLLAKHVGRLAGVDVSRRCIAAATEQNPCNEYKCFDGLNLPYPNASFDAASAVCVFHHVPVANRLPLAQDVRRVLRPRGVFVVFEHNPVNPLTRRVVNNCEFDRGAVLLRKQETETLLKEAGFRDVKSRYILAFPTGGSLSRALDRVVSRIPLGAQYFTLGRS